MTAAPLLDLQPVSKHTRRTPRWQLRLSAWLPVLATSAILLAMFVVGQALFGNFFTPRLISSLFLDNAYLIVLAVGMTYVILTGGIDLSVGAVVAFSGIFGAELLQTGWPALVVIPAIVLSGSVIGALVGVLVQVFEIQPFIASLAAMFLARGLAYVVSLQSIPITDPAITWLERTRLPLGGGWFVTPTVIIALLTVAISVWVLQYTRFGRSVYAIGGNEQSAKLMGLRVARTRIAVYVISGTCAGVAGLIFAAYTGSGYSLTGLGMELDAIAAVVIGGTILTGGSGYVIGSLLGVMVYGLIEISITYIGVDSWWTKIVVGSLLLIFVVLQRLLVSRRKR
ncbi:sugar ABC transporter permease YjfF [Subtercola sp. PAMC28395]|uniref:galactofuranose ABC transporter, permease protein YjfF n=1 Tax=Subtercola sp. PAMC28395 TaxID=2846775 RepID=UPI001C0C1DB7|nr:galactofuranose ABC transporter, permease protein YjfF [Subtercola sp. PAMC28395]QWT24774.1 sugar ABC transporter permease YjfF [Subtercola sp. PAMC28395]